MDASAAAARAFFSGAFSHLGRSGGGGLVEVSVKSPSGTWKSTHLERGALLEAVGSGSFRNWSQRGRDIYYGVVSLTERPEHSWRRGGAKLRGTTEILWLDVDVEAPGREGPEYFESVASAVSGVDACLGPCLRDASLVIGSGWGVQYVIPLAEPVDGRVASQVVRVLVGMVGECTSKKIDRVWDVTRVMRMPGTWNWRAGPDPSDARETGILRWPARASGVTGRLELGNVIDEIARLVNDVPGRSRSDVTTPEQQLEELLDHFGGIAGAADTDPGAYDGDWVGDIERIAFDTLTWADVLEPQGWRCVAGCEPGWEAREHEQVWERPGKPGEAGDWAVKTGDRSAVVYADRPELLVVYSDSRSTGFDAGLRGSGHRGEGAGVGVISKWRAWVDLACKGDEESALELVTSVAHGAHGSGVAGGATGDPVAERLGRAWTAETAWMGDWVRTLEEGVMKAHEKDAGAKLPTKDLIGWDPDTEEPKP